MKIAVDCRMSGKSGVGTFLDGILPFLLQSKNEFFLFGGSQGVPCKIKPFSLKELFCFPKQLLASINACDACFSPYFNIPGGITVPVYTTIHDIVFLDVKGLAGAAGTFIRRQFYLRAVQRSQGIFTVSQFSRERIASRLKCTKPVTVVYNGIPSYIEKNEIPAEKGSDILFIGNIKKHKGLPVLLEAFEKLYALKKLQDGERPRLLIVGSKDSFRSKDSSVFTLIERINAKFPGSVIFTGFVEDSILRQLLSRARLLVQPSLYEGFGIPPLQALCCGTNAVISDIPVFKEIYSGFPVTFFKSGNSDDLCEKMNSVYERKTLEGTVPAIYSYRRTADLILKALTEKTIL